MKPKVFVAMSGGVDSSVAAALLSARGGSAFGGKKSGRYDIIGVFCRGWPVSPSLGGQLEGLVCGWKEERRDAIRAAATLGIPLLTFNFSKEYEEKVVEYMKKEYAEGRTPNPDVMCNKYIKFGMFLNKALEMGADYIATGHYVRLAKAKPWQDCQGLALADSRRLLQAKDKNKDQSYFLWTLTQKQLQHCLFPIGDYTKPEVRRMAQRFGLHNAQKSDSQGLCFVGNINFSVFLRKILPRKTGPVKLPDGRTIGKHDGSHFYTIGQRHGLNIPGGPYYIVSKDLKNNVLIVVGAKEEKNFYQKQVIAENINWISGKKPDLSKKYLGRVRYRQPLQGCKLQALDFKLQVIFDKPQRAVTSGQSLVLYEKENMLGGGIIV